ncbi:MAG: hypothetical protein ACRC0E_07350 [Soonwooa sp.]
MGFEADFNMNDILKNHENIINNIFLMLQDAFELSLLEISNMAKMTDTYTDRTNNLRSSIGYVLFHDGQIVASKFEQSGVGTQGQGTQGVQKGLEVAQNAINGSETDGFIAVYVAGMDYARAVENKGFDVITGSWLQFDNVLQKELKNITEATGVKFTK